MSATWRTSDLTALAVAAAGTVLLTTASFVVAPPDVLPRNDGSSYAPHREGARAAFLVLQQLGYDVNRSFEPLAALKAPPDRTILVIAQPSVNPSEQDSRALRSFIERGGHVLITGVVGAHFLRDLPQRGQPRSSPPRTHTAAFPGALTAGVPEVELPSAGAVVPGGSPFVAVYGNHADPAVLAARIGSGRAVWWAGSGPLSNAGIDKPGHLELFLNSLGSPTDRIVVWDEFYHGHTRSVWSYLAATPLPSAILQLLAVGSLALFTFARRRRPVWSPAVEPRTSPLEFIDTMGGLYERARTAPAAIVTIRTRVRRLLAEAAGLPASTPDDRLLPIGTERIGLGPEASGIMMRADDAASRPDLTSPQALAIARELQSLAVQIQASQRQRLRKY